MQAGNLRELKKSQTREQIAAAAAELFAAHGFDAVTVETVAQHAGVSKKTVFNYFPTKEDLVFDRAEERADALFAAVHERAPGVSVLESFRALCLAQAEAFPRMRAKRTAGGVGFFELVRANPALQRRAHEIHGQLVDLVVQALAAEARTSADDPVTYVVAHTLLGAQRALWRRLQAAAGEDTSAAAIVRRHRRDTNRVFDRLRDGLADYP